MTMRAWTMFLAVGGILLVAGQSGCVSRAEYDRVVVSYRASESERAELRNKLAGAEARLVELQNNEKILTADRDARIAALNALIQKAKDDNDQLKAEKAELIARLQQPRPPDVVFTGPLPAKVSEALKKFAEDHPGLMEVDEKLGLVRFASDVLFDLGSFDLKGEAAKQMSDFAEIINIPEAQAFDVLVVGHTDNVPVKQPLTRERTPTNWHLSCYRAVSVVQSLVKAGANPKRLAAMGFGEERPRVPNKPGGTRENRRVEVYLVPRGSLGAGAGPAPIIGGQDAMALLAR